MDGLTTADGLCGDNWLDYVQAELDKVADKDKLYDVAKGIATLLAYQLKYSDDPLEYLAVELEFRLPIFDPQTMEPCDTGYAGFIDAIVRTPDGRVWILDHKVLGKIPYFAVKKLDRQLKQYLLAAKQTGLGAVGFMYDVIVKPGISPRINQDIPKTWQKELDTGSYHGIPFPPWNGEVRETPLMFCVRCMASLIEKEDKHFVRYSIVLPDAELVDYNRELLSAERAARKLREVPVSECNRNGDQCQAFGKTCPYLPLCLGTDSEDSYRRKTQEEVGTDLSASRLSVLSACRRKFKYKYCEGLSAHEEEYSGALAIGSYVHEKLESLLKNKAKHDAQNLTELVSLLNPTT